MDINIFAHTNGKGLWSDEARPVHINQIGFGYKSTDYYPEDPFNGELRAYYENSGFTSGSWNNDAYGLIYTDKLWMKEFKAALRTIGFSQKAVQNISFSEQGMQGSNYVSMDVGPAFYASWCRVNGIKNTKIKLEEQKV